MSREQIRIKQICNMLMISLFLIVKSLSQLNKMLETCDIRFPLVLLSQNDTIHNNLLHHAVCSFFVSLYVLTMTIAGLVLWMS